MVSEQMNKSRPGSVDVSGGYVERVWLGRPGWQAGRWVGRSVGRWVGRSVGRWGGRSVGS